MADDILPLGLSIDSSDAVSAKSNLDALASVGTKVENALAGVETTAAKTGKSLASIGAGAKAAGDAAQSAASGVQALGKAQDDVSSTAGRLPAQEQAVANAIKQVGDAAKGSAGGVADYGRQVAVAAASGAAVPQQLAGTAAGFTSVSSGAAAAAAAVQQVGRASAGAAASVSPATAAVDKLGISAKQTAAALRGVPAQFTDIAVSLQGGQNPLTVLLQQGGQLKDMFGGIGPAARALGGYVAGLIGPFTLAAGAVGALGYAYFQGSKEVSAYREALILSGNASGATVSQLNAAAEAIGKVTGRQGQAAEAVAAVAQSGAVGAKNLREFTQAALDFERTTGTAVSATVKQFQALAEKPLEATLELNKGLNYVTVELYKQIRALTEQGKTTEAATLAQKAFADAISSRSAEITGNLGLVERGWNAIKTAVLGAGNAIANIGRQNTTAQDLAAAQARAEQLRGERDRAGFASTGGGAALGGASTGGFSQARAAELADLELRAKRLQFVLATENQIADADAKQLDIVKRRSAFDEAGKQYLDNAAKKKTEIAGVEKLLTDQVITREEATKRIAAIEDRFKDKKGPSTAGAESEIARIRALLIERQAELKSLQDYGKEAEKRTEGDKLVTTLQQRLIETTDKTTKARIVDLLVVAKQIAATDAQIAGQKKSIDEVEKLRKAQEQFNDARDKESGRIEGDIVKVQERTQALALENETLGKSAQAIELVAISRLREQRDALVGFENSEARIDQINREIEARQLLVGQLNRKDVIDKDKAAVKQLDTEVERFKDSLFNGLSDSLYRGFEAGKGFFKSFTDGIKNFFKTTVLKLAVQATVGGLGGLVGIGSAGAGALDGGGVGGALSAASSANSAYSLLGNVLTVGKEVLAGTTSLANAVGTIVANTTGTGISGLLATNGAYGTAAAGSAAGVGASVLAAAPYALAAVVALNALGLFRSEKKTDVGFKGTLGSESNVQGFTTIRKGGTLFSGPSYRDELSALPDATKTAIDTSVKGLFDSVKGFADVLGLNASAIDGFTKDIFISTQGLSDAQIQEKLAATFKSLGDDLANLVAGGILSGAKAGSEAAAAAITEDAAGALPVGVGANTGAAAAGQTVSQASALDEYKRAGETSIDTLGRLATSLSGVNGVLDSLNQTALKASLAGGAAASSLVDLFGGLEKFQTVAGSFLQNFYDPKDQKDIVQRQLKSAFADLKIDFPESRAAFRDLVEAQDLTTESGRKTYATLLSLSDAFASVTEAAASAEQKTEARGSIQDRLDTVRGNDRAVLDRQRDREYAAAVKLDPALGELINQLFLAEDAATAAAKAEAIRLGAQNQQIRILQLLGKADEATALQREQELAALDPALRERQKYIYGLEDEATAIAKAEAIRKGAQDQQIRVLELLGRADEATALRREQELAALDPALRARQQYIYGLEDEATALAKADALRKASQDQEIRVLELLGRADEARALRREQELAALDPALRARQRYIYSLEDEATAHTKYIASLDAGYATLERAVAAQRAVLDTQRQVAQESVNSLTAVFNTLQTNIDALQGSVAATRAQAAREGAQFIAEALRNAQTTGYLPDADQLSRAISAVRAGNDSTVYGSQADADRASLLLANQLAQLKGTAGEQLSAAEKQLRATETEIKRLDDILKTSKLQIDALKGIDTSVLSVAEAIERLRQAIKPDAAKPPAPIVDKSGAVVGAGSQGNTRPGTSALGRQTDGSYVGFDGYTSQTYSGDAARRLDRIDPIFGVFAGTGNVKGYYEALRDAGFTLREIAAHDGYYYPDVLAAAAAAGVPAFARGTNYVPSDTFAVVHKGERIIPAADNQALLQALDRSSGTDPALNDKMQLVLERLVAMQDVLAAGNENTKKAADVLGDAQGGRPLQVTPAVIPA